MTPLIIVVGFLGAGKTTFLRGLIPGLMERGLRPSLVLNDYQNARVDAELFRELSTLVTPISGSCVCCGSREELRQALLSYEHAEHGLVLLESNGTTDAEELVAALASDPELRRFAPPMQVNLVDAKRWQKRFWHNELERRQMRTANFFVLGHGDEVSEERCEVVREAVLELVPGVVETSVARLVEQLQDLVEQVAAVAREDYSRGQIVQGPATDHDHSHHHEHEHHHGPEHHHDHAHADDEPHEHKHHGHEQHHFAAAELALPELVSRPVLEGFLRELPREVLRAKGLARVEQSPERWVIFQKVEASDTAQVAELAELPISPHPTLILVGPHLPPMDRYLAKLASAG
jgi:G3E family GTPase